MTALDVDFVIFIHRLILTREAGLKGEGNKARLEGALGRIENRVFYDGLEDVFEIAGL